MQQGSQNLYSSLLFGLLTVKQKKGTQVGYLERRRIKKVKDAQNSFLIKRVKKRDKRRQQRLKMEQNKGHIEEIWKMGRPHHHHPDLFPSQSSNSQIFLSNAKQRTHKDTLCKDTQAYSLSLRTLASLCAQKQCTD